MIKSFTPAPSAWCPFGAVWFQEHSLWQDVSYEPRPGDSCRQKSYAADHYEILGYARRIKTGRYRPEHI